MGGDHAPKEIVSGALMAARELNASIVLTGPAETLLTTLQELGETTLPKYVEIADASQVVDMNDDPTDRSMTKGLRGKANIESVGNEDMFNPWINVLKSGTGTLQYGGKWNLFDQILISPTALNYPGKKDFSTLKYVSHQVFRRDYLFQNEGRFKGGVKRTTAGGQWLDGYSDHLPVVIYVAKWAE